MDESKTICLLRQEIKRLRKLLSETPPDLETLLKTRGLPIYKCEPDQDLLAPGAPHINAYYKKLIHYSFRIFLRDVIKRQEGFTITDVARFTSTKVTAEYITYLLEIGLLEQLPNRIFRLLKRPIRSFGVTLEWFLSEIFKREFGVEAKGGVKFRKPGIGGDYDLLAKINGSLIYMEIKSSPPKQIYPSEIAAFLERISELRPTITIFFMDTELRMKDKIVPMFEAELPAWHSHPPEVRRIEKELFAIGNALFIINAAGKIPANIERVLIEHFRGTAQPL